MPRHPHPVRHVMTSLILGAASSGIAYGAGATPYQAVGIGLIVAVLIWAAAFIPDNLL